MEAISLLHDFLLVEPGDDFLRVVHDGLQLRDGLGGEVLRLGPLVAVFERFVLEPGDVQFEIPILDAGCWIPGKPFGLRAFAQAVGRSPA
jgi:hypothetical protein